MRVLAIDGPAGAGKSTIARALAARLGVQYLDTGAMYRAVAAAVLHAGVEPDDTDRVRRIAQRMRLEIDDDATGQQRVVVDGREVTAEIRGPRVTEAVGAVASNSGVRAELRARQRAWAHDRGGGVMEGRDIGSVVFPDARLKVYLTASAHERALRRVRQHGGDVEEIAAAIARRDAADAARADGPMVVADGSVTVDTTGLTIDEVVERVVSLWEGHDDADSDEARG